MFRKLRYFGAKTMHYLDMLFLVCWNLSLKNHPIGSIGPVSDTFFHARCFFSCPPMTFELLTKNKNLFGSCFKFLVWCEDFFSTSEVKR